MDGDQSDPLKKFWEAMNAKKQLYLLEAEKTLNLKESDCLRAEAMAEEMKLPAGLAVGYAGLRLMAACRKRAGAIEMELLEVEQDLLSSESARSVGIQAPQAFFDDLEHYVTAMEKKHERFTYQAFFRKAINDFWAYRKKTAEKSARRKEMSAGRKGDARGGEKKE